MTDLDHPLNRASEALDATVKQLLIVVAMFAGGVAGTIERAPWGRAVAISGGIVFVAFAVMAWIRAQTRRDRALDLIREGRGSLPVTVVQRECRRLAAPGTRRSLARTLESMIDETLHRGPLAVLSARPLLSRSVIRATEKEISGIASALQNNRVTVRGTAFVEYLVTHGESPLYGDDVTALLRELGRARSLLDS